MPCHTHNICKVSLHHKFFYAQRDYIALRIVYNKRYIQTVSPLDDFAYALQDPEYFENICHMMHTCNYLYVYSYGDTSRYRKKSTHCSNYKHTSFHMGRRWYHSYQHQSLHQRNFHLSNMHNIHVWHYQTILVKHAHYMTLCSLQISPIKTAYFSMYHIDATT